MQFRETTSAACAWEQVILVLLQVRGVKDR